jgi:hypothetical protein
MARTLGADERDVRPQHNLLGPGQQAVPEVPGQQERCVVEFADL